MIQSTPVKCPKCGTTLAVSCGPMTHHVNSNRGLDCAFVDGYITCKCKTMIHVVEGQVVGPAPKCGEIEQKETRA